MRILAVLASLVLAVAAQAQSGSVGDYAGTYAGELDRIDRLSEPDCPDGIGLAATVEAGKLAGTARTGATFQATVSPTGFFEGAYTFEDGTSEPIEGRIEGDRLSGGLHAPDIHCTWTMLMERG